MGSICPTCRESLVEARAESTITRGDQSVTIETLVMVCPLGHPDPAAPEHGVYAIVTRAQAAEFERAIDEAWQAKYGEAVPDPVRKRKKVSK